MEAGGHQCPRYLRVRELGCKFSARSVRLGFSTRDPFERHRHVSNWFNDSGSAACEPASPIGIVFIRAAANWEPLAFQMPRLTKSFTQNNFRFWDFGCEPSRLPPAVKRHLDSFFLVSGIWYLWAYPRG
jgi:hypothetical protein